MKKLEFSLAETSVAHNPTQKKNRSQAMKLDRLGINISLGVFFRTANHDKLETCVFTGRRLSYGGFL